MTCLELSPQSLLILSPLYGHTFGFSNLIPTISHVNAQCLKSEGAKIGWTLCPL